MTVNVPKWWIFKMLTERTGLFLDIKIKKIKENDLIVALFISNAVSMSLELIIARILSPYFGSQNTTMTIVVSLMIFSNTIGNYLGGILSDKKDLPDINIFLHGVSALFIAATSFAYRNFNAGDYDTAAVISSLILIPCACIGMLSPVVNRRYLLSSDGFGKMSGKIYMIISAGSLTGTLVCGLMLIPFFGCGIILYVLSCIMALETLYFIFTAVKSLKVKWIYSVVFIAAVVMICVSDKNSASGSRLTFDTADNYVEIYDTEYKGEPVSMMSISGGYSSACFKDPRKRDELVFQYTKMYDEALNIDDAHNSVLLMGGAGYSYPRYFISHFPDKTIDVVEIDGGITDIARKYFYLDDFIKEYGGARLGLYTEDARLFVENTEKKYDIILNDTFLGRIPAASLCTVEAARAIKNRLNDGGIYSANMVSHNQKFVRCEIKTIENVFAYVWVKHSGDNWVIYASDTDYGMSSDPGPEQGSSFILTDDYAPVETMNLL